jgi:hypothetical protein
MGLNSRPDEVNIEILMHLSMNYSYTSVLMQDSKQRFMTASCEAFFPSQQAYVHTLEHNARYILIDQVQRPQLRELTHVRGHSSDPSRGH